MEWSEYMKTPRFKYLEELALEHSRKLDEVFKRIEEDCPLPEGFFYSISARNKCVSRFFTAGGEE